MMDEIYWGLITIYFVDGFLLTASLWFCAYIRRPIDAYMWFLFWPLKYWQLRDDDTVLDHPLQFYAPDIAHFLTNGQLKQMSAVRKAWQRPRGKNGWFLPVPKPKKTARRWVLEIGLLMCLPVISIPWATAIVKTFSTINWLPALAEEFRNDQQELIAAIERIRSLHQPPTN